MAGGRKWRRDTSKWRSFSGSCREMRKKVSLHQTQELPLLQTAPAQRRDETRYLILNWSPTALLGERECVSIFAFFNAARNLDSNSLH